MLGLRVVEGCERDFGRGGVTRGPGPFSLAGQGSRERVRMRTDLRKSTHGRDRWPLGAGVTGLSVQPTLNT